MNNVARAFASTLLIPILCGPHASGQVAAGLTVLEARNLLQTALDGLNNSLKTAGGEIKSAGDSLQGNAQNVIADMNQMLGSKLNLTFDKLNKQEQALVADAQVLTKQINDAANQVVNNAGDQARSAIAEADITAYDASYSIPCRDQNPRFVYVQPNFIRVGADRPEVKIRGNFLAIGNAPDVKVGDRSAKIISRADTEILVQIPPETINSITVEKSIPISATLNALHRTNLWVYCYSHMTTMDHPLSVATVLKPKLSIKIIGSISGTADASNTVDESYTFDNGTGDNCDASFEADKSYCMKVGRVLDSWTGPSVSSANGNDTGIRSTTRQGDRCVEVAAHIAGKGYSISVPTPFGSIKNCNGRGWLAYGIVLHGHEAVTNQLPSVPISVDSLDGSQRSFLFHYGPLPAGSTNPNWRYEATLNIAGGQGQAEVVIVSTANPNAGRVQSRLVDGDLAIEVQ